MDICDVDNYLTCSSCELTIRSEGAQYSITELGNGCCRVIVVDNVSPFHLIQEGSGPIATIGYDVSTSAPEGECRDLNTETVGVLDEFSNMLDVASSSGEFCFTPAPESPTSIPTLSEWGMIIFMTIIMGIGIVTLFRRRKV